MRDENPCLRASLSTWCPKATADISRTWWTENTYLMLLAFRGSLRKCPFTKPFFLLLDFFHPQNIFSFHVLGKSFEGVRDSLLLLICCFFVCFDVWNSTFFRSNLSLVPAFFGFIVFFVRALLLFWCFCLWGVSFMGSGLFLFNSRRHLGIVFPRLLLRAPRCGSGPNCRFGGHPPPPRTLPSSQSPSLPTVPLFPHPPGTFCNAPGWATWAGVGEAAHGGGRGGSSKRHLGPDPHLGAFDALSRCCFFYFISWLLVFSGFSHNRGDWVRTGAVPQGARLCKLFLLQKRASKRSK